MTRAMATGQLEVPVTPSMVWDDIKEIAAESGVPGNATVRILVDRNPNPTPLDGIGPSKIQFSWELFRNPERID